MTVRLGWEVLLAQARQEALPDTARHLCWPQERVRQTLSRAQRQLRWMARKRSEGETLWTWAVTPRVVAVPDGDEGWGVLVNAFQGGDRLELRSVRLAPGRWALYRSEVPPYTFCHATVPMGAARPAAQYGVSKTFRQALTARGLTWAVGIVGHQKVFGEQVTVADPTRETRNMGRPRKHGIPSESARPIQDVLHAFPPHC